MGVVFIVLIALAVASAVMSWMDSSDAVRNFVGKFSRDEAEKPGLDAATPDKAAAPAGPSGEEIAAITVAVAMARRSSSRLLPAAAAATGAGPSAWATAGRRRAMERAPGVDR